MKALIQNYKTGELTIAEMPEPALLPGGVLVRTHASLVSAGTERLMVGLAKKGLIGKALERPDLVRKVFEKARRDGVLSAFETVKSRLDTPVALGYSSAGVVMEAGAEALDFSPGDRVACAGAGYAGHAEVVYVPRNLVAKIPKGVEFEHAAFTTLGAIALQGLRLAKPQIGDTVAVIGLGLLGLLSVQLLRASGCAVVGMDPNAVRCRDAEGLGATAALTSAEETRKAAMRLTSGHGVDSVLITASTSDNSPVKLAGNIARGRAVVVAVGVTGMEIPRKEYFDRELTFIVSRSYGPGRYDPEYEEKGRDYPVSYVRWTENRNMQAFLAQLAAAVDGGGGVDVSRLITHRFDIENAHSAYDLITAKASEDFMGILLKYPHAETPAKAEAKPKEAPADSAKTAIDLAKTGTDEIVFGFLGAGQFACATLIPMLKQTPGAVLKSVCTSSGVSAWDAARKFGFKVALTNEDELIDDPEVDAVVIATRHNQHAGQVLKALRAGKHVFVEKPLCLHQEELEEITALHAGLAPARVLMVGYNRRFSPMARRLKEFTDSLNEPLIMHYRVNAGYIPSGHWSQDSEQGGGRIIGEVCHFIDFMIYLSGSLPLAQSTRFLPNSGKYCNDNLVMALEFSNGSLGNIIYTAGGDKSVAKERVEVWGGGATAVLDNFRSLTLVKDGKKTVMKSRLKQDKGFRDEWRVFMEGIRTGEAPIPMAELRASTIAAIEAQG